MFFFHKRSRFKLQERVSKVNQQKILKCNFLSLIIIVSFLISLFMNLNDLYESLSKEFEPLFKAEENKSSLSSSEASKKQDG